MNEEKNMFSLVVKLGHSTTHSYYLLSVYDWSSLKNPPKNLAIVPNSKVAEFETWLYDNRAVDFELFPTVFIARDTVYSEVQNRHVRAYAKTK